MYMFITNNNNLGTDKIGNKLQADTDKSAAMQYTQFSGITQFNTEFNKTKTSNFAHIVKVLKSLINCDLFIMEKYLKSIRI